MESNIDINNHNNNTMNLNEKSNSEKINCLSCKKYPITYMCMPCRCPTLCKKCAMKMATGGKCKICGNLFCDMARLN